MQASNKVPVVNKPAETAEVKQNATNELFQDFLDAVKANNINKVDKILNHHFKDAESRAAFGNRQDNLGNTAYHYAANYGHKDIITLFNNKKSFQGKQKFIRFNIKNNESKTPLDLACIKGNYETFKEIWTRAGKSNHNPIGSLESAKEGKNSDIIQEIQNHPKAKK